MLMVSSKCGINATSRPQSSEAAKWGHLIQMNYADDPPALWQAT